MALFQLSLAGPLALRLPQATARAAVRLAQRMLAVLVLAVLVVLGALSCRRSLRYLQPISPGIIRHRAGSRVRVLSVCA
jgi:hypothetical protein